MRASVVTGGNRGIGYAVCESLAHKDFRTVAVVRDPAAAIPDGVEESFVVNHLGPFQLNLALEGQVCRVVQVSAGLHVKGRVDPDRTPYGKDFHRVRTYCDIKRANLLLVPLFARRWQDAGATIDAVHPGVIRTGPSAPCPVANRRGSASPVSSPRHPR